MLAIIFRSRLRSEEDFLSFGSSISGWFVRPRSSRSWSSWSGVKVFTTSQPDPDMLPALVSSVAVETALSINVDAAVGSAEFVVIVSVEKPSSDIARRMGV
jgi:hypothetical protein